MNTQVLQPSAPVAKPQAGSRHVAWTGLLPPLLVTVIWGVNTVLVKYMALGFPPVEMQATRLLAACALLIPMALCQGWRSAPAAAWKLAGAAAFVSVFAHQILLAYGMTLSKAGLGSLILSLNPLTTAVLAHFTLGERLTGRQVVGVLLGFAGVMTAVGDEWLSTGLQIGLGEALVFGAMLVYAGGGIFVKKARGLVPPLQLTAMIQGLGAAMLAAVAGARVAIVGLPQEWPGPVFWVVVVCSGLIATGLSNFIWNRSIQDLGAARTSMFLNGMPFVSLVTAMLLFGEQMVISQLLGLAAVVGGIYLGTGGPRRQKPTVG